MKEPPETDPALREILAGAGGPAEPDDATRLRVTLQILELAGPELRCRRRRTLADRLLRTARWSVPTSIAAATVLAIYLSRLGSPDVEVGWSPGAAFFGSVIGTVSADWAVNATVGSADGSWFLAEVVSHE
jgi:hypothetical protein